MLLKNTHIQEVFNFFKNMCQLFPCYLQVLASVTDRPGRAVYRLIHPAPAWGAHVCRNGIPGFFSRLSKLSSHPAWLAFPAPNPTQHLTF